MIDIENEVFTTVKTALDGISTLVKTGENKNNTFPLTTMQEIDNSSYVPSEDSDSLENHAAIGYQFDTYTNTKSGKKSQNKAIMAIIDESMLGMGFARISLVPFDNVQDMTIYRMVSRYNGVVGTDDTVYRR